ncbi:MAG: 2-polyprenylphenol 6-hydroxylase [Rickettsiales bacterium]|nr:MAG: 2-polyprenylphenol 6-hydroxylase [Rickettsiales bacterium]
MFKFITHTKNFLKFFYIISKYRILTENEQFITPTRFRIIGIIGEAIFYPKNLFTKTDISFGMRLAELFQNLGPIYIKFGQSLSTRPDLVGIQVAKSLQILQDKLPPFDFSVVKDKIEARFNQKINEIFIEFDERPIAAASIAQVHKAKLRSGEMVAVKVLRPDIIPKYEKDIHFLEYCAHIIPKFLPKIKRLKPTEIIFVFRQTMQMELNFRIEAASASRIYDNFVDDDMLCVPKIYWQYTAQDILITQWIDGVSIYDHCSISNLGIKPKNIAANIAVIFFNQAYRDGFFHADLHPGNIIIRPNGQVSLIDYGIVGILPESDRLAIAEILHAFLNRDYIRVAHIHKRVNYIPQNTNLDYFAQSCRAIAEPIIGLAINDISIGNLLGQLFKVTEEYGMEMQPQLLLLQKTMVMVEGIGQSLDPNINMWQLAEPWIKKWAAKNLSPEAKLLRLAKNIINNLL